MMTRFFNQLRLPVFSIVVATGLSSIAGAQLNRPPRLKHLPAEKATDVSKQLDPVYDQAKDQTTHFLSGVLVVAEALGREVQVPGESQKRRVPSGVMKMVVYYQAPGKTRARPEQIILAFNAGSAFGFEYGEHRDLSVQLPVEKLELGRMDLTSTKDEGHRDWGFYDTGKLSSFLSAWVHTKRLLRRRAFL